MIDLDRKLFVALDFKYWGKWVSYTRRTRFYFCITRYTEIFRPCVNNMPFFTIRGFLTSYINFVMHECFAIHRSSTSWTHQLKQRVEVLIFSSRKRRLVLLACVNNTRNVNTAECFHRNFVDEMSTCFSYFISLVFQDLEY